MESRRSILLTGAAGRIGSAFFSDARDSYRFVLADNNPEILESDPGFPHTALRLDVADLEGCRHACQGIDTVIHLAADPSPAAGFHESLLESNFSGTYNIFRAAADNGCRRVIVASSVHAIGGYPDGPTLLESDPVWPVNMYGVSKCFAEATARKFASADELSAIAIRIGAYEAPWIRDDATPKNLSMFISVRDMNRLLGCCINVQNVDFAILHGISNNREKRLSIEATRQLVGYDPIDDGFARYQANS